MRSIHKSIQIFSALSLGEGVVALIWLMSLPTSRQTYSVVRLFALLGILLVLSISAATLIYFRTQRTVPSRFSERITNRRNRIPLSFLLITVSLVLWVSLLLKDQWLLFVSESTYIRLLPIIGYGLVLCFQAGVFLLLIGRSEIQWADEFKRIWKVALVLWGVFLAVWLLMSLFDFGFTYDNVGLSWGPPGTPITFAQVQLVLAAGFLLVFGWHILKPSLHRISPFLFYAGDIVVFLGLWSLAVILWSNQPMSPTHFAPAPMPPNNEYYPNSDALIFDRSSYHLLYGTGFANQLTRRPLYVGMLAFFHKIAGADYENTISLQILILALIPPLVFLFTSKLSNRMSGLVAGGLILLRERNAIELSDVIVTSHAKLMMSDMIAMLGVVLILYATVKLLSRENSGNWETAIAGACLGLTALIRAQVLILVPVLLFFILLSKRPSTRAFRASVFALLGLVLAMSPWVWRNWNLTGTFVLDDRGEERLLARNYSLTPFALPSPLAGETEKEFSARLKNNIFTFILTHPANVRSFISNHFFRNLATSSVYIAPSYSADSAPTMIKQLAFWNEWRGDLPSGSGISLFINLGLVAFGIGIATRKNKVAGSFPLIAFLVYGFGNALVRSSGWRFIQPADWIILVYYSMALAYFPSKIKSFFGENIQSQAVDKRLVIGNTAIFPVVTLFILLLLGASVPIAERLNQTDGYQSFSENAKVDLSKEQYISSTEIETFLEQENAVLISGQALYPRYIRPNSRVYLADAPKGYRYLHFWLINEADHQIVLPLLSSPEDIPHTATVTVIGCQENRYISAFAVIVQEPSKQILIRDPQAPLRCPLDEPQ